MRGRTGVWIARVTLAVYWGLAAAGYLLRGLNDAAFAAGDELTTE